MPPETSAPAAPGSVGPEDRLDGADTPAAASSGDQFPVDSFREAAEHLRRPFSRSAVKFRIVRGGQVAAHVDARVVIERLNLVVPHLWEDPVYIPVGNALECRLTVDGLTRSDIGSGYADNIKGLRSDAFKRAAVKFGVGVSLYAIPAVDIDGQYKVKRGKATFITPDGLKHLRDRYDGWLENGGEKKFGEVLDHGDSEDAAGDLEAEGGAEPEDQAPEGPQPLDTPEAQALVERAEELHKNVPATQMPPAQFKRQLASARSSMPDLENLVAALEGMQQ